jgi:hypothetical protein
MINCGIAKHTISSWNTIRLTQVAMCRNETVNVELIASTSLPNRLINRSIGVLSENCIDAYNTRWSIFLNKTCEALNYVLIKRSGGAIQNSTIGNVYHKYPRI